MNAFGGRRRFSGAGNPLNRCTSGTVASETAREQMCSEPREKVYVDEKIEAALPSSRLLKPCILRIFCH
jgi:hypothetical protein